MAEALRDVITGLVSQPGNSNDYAPKLTDDNVKYNVLGRVPQWGADSRTGVRETGDMATNTFADLAANQSRQIKHYVIDADFTVPPSAFDPDTFLLYGSGLTAPRTWTIPDDATIVNYLKAKYDGNMTSGFLWTVKIQNSLAPGGSGFAINFTALGGGVQGTNDLDAAGADLAGSHHLRASDTAEVSFHVRQITDGFESVKAFITGGTNYDP